MREWLKQIRLNEKLTCKEVAGKCNFSPEYFTMIEKGNRRPSPDTAKLIAEKLNFKNYGYDWTKFYSSNEKKDVKSGSQSISEASVI